MKYNILTDLLLLLLLNATSRLPLSLPDHGIVCYGMVSYTMVCYGMVCYTMVHRTIPMLSVGNCTSHWLDWAKTIIIEYGIVYHGIVWYDIVVGYGLPYQA